MRYELLESDTTWKGIAFPPIPAYKTPPWGHQLAAFWWGYNRPGTMLSMYMGTGKSKVAVDLVNNNPYNKVDDYGNSVGPDVLILCPKNPMKVWPREFGTHSAGWWEALVLDEKVGNNRRKTEKASNFFLPRNRGGSEADIRVCVITYDSAYRDQFKKFSYNKKASHGGNRMTRAGNVETAGRLDRIAGDGVAGPLREGDGWDVCIADEVHRIKAAGGKISKYVHALGRRATYRLGLTGTPMPHSPQDIYGQYRFLDERVFGTSKKQFDTDYVLFKDRHIAGKVIPEVVGYHEDKLSEKYHSICFQVSKDVLDLPGELHVPRFCALSARARRIYDDVDAEYLAALEEDVDIRETVMEGGPLVVGDNTLTKLLRLQQIAGGFATFESMGEEGDTRKGQITQVDTGKSDLLMDILVDWPEGEPVVVFCKFRPELDEVEKIAGALGKRYAEISGRVSAGDRGSALNERAELREGVDVAGVQIQAGGAGIDLTRARYAVYYSVGHSLGDYDQSVNRVHRPPQSRPVEFIHLLTEGTVDEEIYEAIDRKRDIVESVSKQRLARVFS